MYDIYQTWESSIDWNEFSSDPSVNDNSNHTWYYVRRTNKLLECENDTMECIAKQY